MSIRVLARELYQAQQRLDALRQAVAAAPEGERRSLAAPLRAAEEEWRLLRRMLDGQKGTESPAGSGRTGPGSGGRRG